MCSVEIIISQIAVKTQKKAGVETLMLINKGTSIGGGNIYPPFI